MPTTDLGLAQFCGGRCFATNKATKQAWHPGKSFQNECPNYYYEMKIFSNDRHPDWYRDAKPNDGRTWLKSSVTGVSCPDPMDRNKNDYSLCKKKKIANSKMNDMKLMKAKGGHSWPPILCKEISDVLCGHFCPSLEFMI